MKRVRQRIHVDGIVQGVGFRPFVYSLARRSGLSGHVGNGSDGVFIEVEGSPAAVARFRGALADEAPQLAVVERIRAADVAPTGDDGFAIAASRDGGPARTLISPDTATCADCLSELFDPADRRYRYPFVNCTNCGPRFTVVRDVPYDRPSTTMAGFPMCPDCAAEYNDPTDRRFHAQPVCCPDCGPTLSLRDRTGAVHDGDPIEAAADALRRGNIAAVKGLGGYHLAVDASSAHAVEALRARKHREDKAFAVMVADVAGARELCHIDAEEGHVLSGMHRPIVLLRRRDSGALADAVAPGNDELGLMLPYTPLHHLLVRALGRPFVLTSGNVSDEPIAHEDTDAFERLGGIADLFLTHDRPIRTRTDDSVVRLVGGREMPVRRSRGYVPRPLRLEQPADRPILACGAELKNTFCLTHDTRAFVSHHIGDLENVETLRSFADGIEHFRRLFRVTPEVVAHDLHPEYLSTKYALGLEGVDLVGVQHHHAHIVSCLVDNAERGPVIGVAFDGLGYGSDETIWGGEFLVADLVDFRRMGHLGCVPMPGGAAAITEPWRMACSYLDAAYDTDVPDDLAVAVRNADRWASVRAVTQSRVNAPMTSSAGRLFDAVAALVGVRDTVTYEGQAAVELQRCAASGEGGSYPAGMQGGTPFRVSGVDLVRAVVADMRTGVQPDVIAARFHNSVADLVLAGCERVRDASGWDTVALSGGVFQNTLLLRATLDRLARYGFRVLVHSRVPTNDAGISLGQTAVAAARDRP